MHPPTDGSKDQKFNWLWNQPSKSDGPTNPNASPFTDTVQRALPVIQKIEDASGDPNARNPKTGALGPYQLMPDTAKRFGVDATDPDQSKMAAGKLLTEYLKKFDGDLAKSLAAYDGDSHIESDEKKYGGDWIRGAKPETLDYLNKAQKGGLELNLSAADREFIVAQLAAARGGSKTTQTASAPGKTDDARPARSGVQPIQMNNIKFTFSNTTGSSIAVSASQLPQ